jgi:hypothetical protein
MYNILKKTHFLSVAHSMSTASLRGLLDLEDAGAMLLKVGIWLLRNGITPQKTSIFMINTDLRT